MADITLVVVVCIAEAVAAMDKIVNTVMVLPATTITITTITIEDLHQDVTTTTTVVEVPPAACAWAASP